MKELKNRLDKINQKYEGKYQELITQYKAKLNNNARLEKEYQVEENNKLSKVYQEKAQQLNNELLEEKKKVITAKKSELERKDTLKSNSKPTVEDKLDKLITLQVMNSSNDKLIKAHLEDNLENREVVQLMKYHYDSKENKNVNVGQMINDALTTNLDRLDKFERDIRQQEINKHIIYTGGMGHHHEIKKVFNPQNYKNHSFFDNNF
ncbi:hypothetical protein [Orenia marismortui]|uniref:Uncharacterized protein n=1 Tax=Orenia marismortui TaxID=46469 RepID=A0A4R8GQ32_9FIRM|nr:hypothetical protein [Orenia marismortui]TDX44591.1 hypothetical protein C7959_15015 [Orenia marismortui]